MLKKCSLLVVLLVCSSMLFAQNLTAPRAVSGPVDSRTQEQAKDAPDTTTCSFSYASGAGEFFTRYCLSVNGNVVQFDSPAGFEYINAGAVAEGYGICDITGGGSYFDYAYTDSANWGATAVSFPSAVSAKFVRITSNGIWQLTQTIKQIKASGSGTGSTKITMAVKNLTGIARDIFLVRYADVDANGTSADDEFNYGNQTAVGQENLHTGLMLTNNTSIPDHYGATWSVFSGPADPCSFNTNRNFGPFVGDGSIGHLWHFTVPAGGTKTMNATYKPF